MNSFHLFFFFAQSFKAHKKNMKDFSDRDNWSSKKTF